MTEEGLPPQPSLPGMPPEGPPMPEFPPDEELFSDSIKPNNGEVNKSTWTPTEAPASFYTVMHMPDGGWISMTVRGDSPIATLDAFMGMREVATKRYGITAAQAGTAVQAGMAIPPQTVPPSTTGQTMPPMPPPQNPGQATSTPPEPSTDPNSGSFEIRSIVVQPTGTVEFNIGPFQWPVKDSRSPSTIANIFDQSTGVNAEWLSSAKLFEPAKFGQVWMADWKKVAKPSKKEPGKTSVYYNIERVWVKSRPPSSP